MRRLFAMFLLLLAAGTAGLSADDPKTLEDYQKLVTPALRKTLDEQFAFLNRWPDASARRAAEQIVSIGDPAVPDLLRELNGGHWRAQVAAAYISGQLRVALTFDAVAGSARDPKVRSHLGVYFKAMARIDRRKAVGALIGFVGSRYTEVRELAMRYLSGLIKPADLKRVLALSRQKRRGSRAAGMALLGVIGGDQARARLLEGLTEDDPSVATAASVALARGERAEDRKETIAALQKMLGAIDRRHRAYAGLTLVRIEDAHGGRLFPAASHVTFLRMLGHTENLVRASAAIAMANFGRYSKDPQVKQALDKQVVPQLIDTLGTARYFKHLSAVRPLSLLKLRELSSEDFGKDYRKWSRWWLANKEQFQAIRRLEQVPVDRLGDLRIQVRRFLPGRRDDRWLFGCTWAPGYAKRYPEALIVVLSIKEMNRLVGSLRAAGFFSRTTERLTLPKGKALWDVQLSLGRRTRRLASGSPPPSDLLRIVEMLAGLTDAQEWQRYWDQRFWPEWGKWYAYYRVWWSAPERTLTERIRKLKSMIVTSFAGLPPNRRRAAAIRLAELVDEDPILTKNQAMILVALLKALGGFGPTEQALARALAKSRQPSAVTDLVKFLLGKSAKLTQPILESMFSHMGKNVALAFLEHQEVRLRAAACAGMWRYGGEEIDLALVRALKDKNSLVRQGAVYSLGKRRKRLAVPTLKDLLGRATDENLRRSIYAALGRIGGDDAFATLTGALKSAEPELKPTLLASLGHTGDKRAIDPLLTVFFDGKDGSLREVAAAALLELPRKSVQKRLVGVALDSGAALDRRALALDLLGRKWSRLVGRDLPPLLSDPQPALKRRAALLLAYHRNTAVVPVLIEALAARPTDGAVRAALEAATMTRCDGSGDKLVEQYRSWWKAHGKVSWRQWLFNALKENAYPVSSLLSYALEGKYPGAGVATLIDALTDSRWYLRHGASLALNQIFDLPRPPLSRHASRDKQLEAVKIWSGVWQRRKGGK